VQTVRVKQFSGHCDIQSIPGLASIGLGERHRSEPRVGKRHQSWTVESFDLAYGFPLQGFATEDLELLGGAASASNDTVCESNIGACGQRARATRELVPDLVRIRAARRFSVRHSALVVIAVALTSAVPETCARAQDTSVPCDAFVKNPDGSWSALRDAPILDTGQRLTIRGGSVLRPGASIRGLDLAATLDQQCPAEPAPVQASAPVAAPRAVLGTYADANGIINAERLTCAQLADTSPEEASLYFAWYSGWYNGAAKRRGINLERVRYAIQNAIDYCKGNRDKKLVQVMELMLK
jgi:HdeA/HdeB family